MEENVDKQKKDDILCQLFSLLESLSNLRKQYDGAVAEGYINMSKARFNLGATSVSYVKYPSSVTHTVGITTESILDEHTFSLVLLNEISVDNESELRQRFSHQLHDMKTSVKNPITWFSALPVSTLQSSQKHFKQSIEIAVAMANVQSKIQHLLIVYKSLCN